MNYFQKYLVDEFAEDYSEGLITRRKALKLIASVTGSLVLANTILAGCTPPAGEGEPTGVVDLTTPTAEIPVTAATDTPAAMATTEATMAATGTSEATMAATEAAGVTPTAEATVLATEATTPSATINPVTVQPDDPALGEAAMITFPGADDAEVSAYLARPAGDGPFPVVLVCHENRGLTAHIQDVARRLAKAGYVALAVDLLSRSGGTEAVGADNVPGVLGNTEPQQFVDDFFAGREYLAGQTYADTDRTGMTGFCFGGGVTWRVAIGMPDLLAAVPYYGPHPPVEEVPQIEAAVLAIYGGNDERINATIPEIEAAMQANGKTYQKMVYEGADHAFHNDTGPRYNAEAAQDAWQRTLDWFAQYLA